jgi:hypothetical protein
MVTICTTMFNIHKLYILPTKCITVMFGWPNQELFSLGSIICFVFTTETESVYCVVRTIPLDAIQFTICL